MRKQSSTLWFVIGAFVIVGGSFVLLVKFAKPASTVVDTRSTREVSLSCTTDEATTYHIHAHLSVVINDVVQSVPADIGITNDCMHPLHTHDIDGIIHVESPVERVFTVGDFFAVWGRVFTKDQIFDSVADATHNVIMTVNGQPSDAFENLVLKDDDQIVITYQEIRTE